MSIVLDPLQKEYLNSNLWEMTFTDDSDFSTIGIPGITATDMRFLVVSTSLPFEKFEVSTRKTGSKHISEIMFVEEFSMTFNETENLDVFKYFSKWKEKIYDSKSKTFRSRVNQTKNAVFSIQKFSILSDLRIAAGIIPGGLLNASFASDLKYQTIASFEFKNVMFKGFEDLDWDYAGEGNKQITVNFSVDEIIPDDVISPQGAWETVLASL